MKSKHLLLLILILFISGITYSQPNWQEIKSVKDICSAYSIQMKTMLGELNLNYPGLEKVKEAFLNEEIEKACTYLLEYYKNCDNARQLRKVQPEKTAKTEALADTILKNVFVIQNVRGEVPWGADGHRDWYYKGPNNDREWAWLSNRHSQLEQVFNVYFETGNPKYAEYIDLFLRDFIIKSMPYPNAKGYESIWRGLEVAARAKVWSNIFYGLLNSDFLSPATQLLMLSSLPDLAHYNRNFHGGNNWLTMEISALATVATNFPEYKNSPEWLDYSIKTMVESMNGQVYEDGVQTELTSHYHIVAMSNFSLFKDICERANQKLPDFFNQTIEDMYGYVAHGVRPNGYGILNNDGNLDNNRELILEGAGKFNHPDWEYIATNGRSGTKPLQGPSYFYPWAGQLISRSGFDEDAQWSFFDMGPWGSGHQHNDKMHISISAYGRDLLVDAGRFAYTGEVAQKFRKYATGSQGHNVLLIDGNGQAAGPKIVEKPVAKKDCLITSDYDYGRGSFTDYNDLEGKCKHTRTLYYARGDFWVVIDQVATDRPRKIEALWHWHPTCKVEIDNNIVSTVNDRGNLQIIPVESQTWDVNLVKGQEKPDIQGWYSREYNIYEPNAATIYSTKIESNTNFVWVLYPSEYVENGVQAEIISETQSEIKVKIKNKNNDEWVVTVPLSDEAQKTE